MQWQVPGSRNQTTTNKTPLNAENEDNMIVLEKNGKISLEIILKF